MLTVKSLYVAKRSQALYTPYMSDNIDPMSMKRGKLLLRGMRGE